MPAPRHTSLTQAKLRELLHYNLRTGTFTWRVARRGIRLGDVAGASLNNRHRLITIDGRPYVAQRLAWLYVRGTMPEGRLTFLDRDPLNLKWANIALMENFFSMSNTAVYQRKYRKDRRTMLDAMERVTAYGDRRMAEREQNT